MMAVIMRNAKANPYWNVPPELIRSLTAKRISEQGLSYLESFHYEVLSDWSAERADHRSEDRQLEGDRVAARQEPTILVRQLPGPWNSMRDMKFEMPNDYGIYLHDTPHKELFAQNERWVSNGCVRLQDYRRFADLGVRLRAAGRARRASRSSPAAAGADLPDLPDGRAEQQRRGVPARPSTAGTRWRCRRCSDRRSRRLPKGRALRLKPTSTPICAETSLPPSRLIVVEASASRSRPGGFPRSRRRRCVRRPRRTRRPRPSC